MFTAKSPFLTDDVYQLPTDDKANERKASDYKSLYGDRVVCRHYHNKRDKAFQAQFAQLLKKLKKWGEENKCNFTTKTDTFHGNFFNPRWADHKEIWYEKFKTDLETIWFHTQRKDLKDFEKAAIDAGLTDVFSKCSAVSRGSLTNLVEQLNNDVSMQRWLSRLCNQIINDFASDHIEKNKIKVAFRGHVQTKCWLHARKEGFPCTFDVSGTEDEYTRGAKITAKLPLLTTLLVSAFTPKNIIDHLVKEFKSELGKHFKIKQNEWFRHDYNGIIQIEMVLKKLNLDIRIDQIFDSDDDNNCFRLNEFKFKQMLLKNLKDKDKLFKSANWKKIDLPNKITYWAFDEKTKQSDLFYLEDQDPPEDSKDTAPITFERLLPLCQIPSAAQEQLRKAMASLAEEKLEAALEKKDSESFMKIIKAGYPLDRENKHESTPIEEAAGAQAWDCVHQIMDLYEEEKRIDDISMDAVLLLAINRKKQDVIERIKRNEYGFDPNSRILNETGLFMLHLAILQNNSELAHFLLARGADPNMQYERQPNPTPLMVAVSNEVKMDMFKLLIARRDVREAIDRENENKLTALELAAANGQTEKLKQLIPIAKKYSKDIKKRLNNAFLKAVAANHIETAQLLKDAGASIKIDLGPVVAAKNWNMFNFLMQNGYPLDAKNKAGQTPMYLAVTHHQWESVKVILKEQPSDEKNNLQYGVCLLFAVKYKECGIVNDLLESKTNLDDWYDKDGYSALHYSILHNDTPLAQRLSNNRENINLSSSKDNCRTPLHLASLSNQVLPNTFNWLLERPGINLDKKDKEHNTALILSAETGSLEKVQALFEQKAKIDEKNKVGKTALMIAEEKNHLTVVNFLNSYPVQMRILHERLDRTDYPEAAKLLIQIYHRHPDQFVKTLTELKPVILEKFNPFIQATINEAAESRNLIAIQKLIQVVTDPNLLLKPLANAIQKNDFGFGQISLLIQHYKETAGRRSPDHPVTQICSSKIKLDTFKLVFNHLDFKQELKNDSGCSFYISQLIAQDAKDKAEFFIKQRNWQLLLANPNNMSNRIENETYRLIKTKILYNQKILETLQKIQQKKLKEPIDTQILTDEKTTHAILDLMQMTESERNRIRFILGELNNKPIESKQGGAFNKDWYNQAFLIAHYSTDKNEYSLRQKRIRERAYKEFCFNLKKISKTNIRESTIKEAKSQPIFNHHRRRHFLFFGEPDTLKNFPQARQLKLKL